MSKHKAAELAEAVKQAQAATGWTCIQCSTHAGSSLCWRHTRSKASRAWWSEVSNDGVSVVLIVRRRMNTIAEAPLQVSDANTTEVLP